MAVAALALLAGACRTGAGGGEVQTATPAALNQDYLAQVADASTAARTGRFDMTLEVEGATGSVMRDDVRASGSYDADAGTYQQRLTMKVVTKDIDIELIGTPDGTYERGTAFAMLGIPADKWVHLPFGTAVANPVGSATTGDPSAMLDTLRAAGAVVEDRGSETIDGVETRHVHTTATLDDVGNRLSDEQRDKLSKSMQGFPGGERLKALLDAPIGLDVYIDRDNRVRRLVVDIELAGLGGTTGSSSAMSVRETIDYHDYGAAVSIVVPSAADTVDGRELLRSLSTVPGTVPYR